MPTVLGVAGFRLVIYLNDHPPAHVHVFRAGKEAVITLGDDATGPSLEESRGMPPAHLRDALRIVEMEQARLLIEWRRIHG